MNDRIGLAIGAGDLQYLGAAWLAARLDEAVDLGVGWIRTDCNWSWIEGTQGVFDWSQVDAVVAAAKARGLQVLLVLGTIPSWARPAGQPETYGATTAAHRSGFATFATAAVTRYKADVRAWEIWNEPNHPPFWSSPDPVSYTALLQAVYPAIKAADPAATVLTGGTAFTNSSGVETLSWYTQLYASGARSYFDMLAMHTYQDIPLANAGTYDSGELAKVADVRSLMNANGDTAKPIWATEFGAPTGGTNAVTEDVQQAMLAEGRALFFDREPLGRMFLYTIRDRQPVGSSADREDYFGLTTTTGRKLAYTEWKTWITFAPPPPPPPLPSGLPVETPGAPDLIATVYGEARRMTVSVYRGADYRRIAQLPNYVSCEVTWQWLGVGGGTLVVEEDDPIAPVLLSANSAVVPVIVDVGSVRWTGRVASTTLEREGPPGSGLVTATLVDDWIWLRAMLASQLGANPNLPTSKKEWAAIDIRDRLISGEQIFEDWTWQGCPQWVTDWHTVLISDSAVDPTNRQASIDWLNLHLRVWGMPKFDTETAPIASLAASYIGQAALRLDVPVAAEFPERDTSPVATLNARMTTLADLLTDPLTAAGVGLTAHVALPGDGDFYDQPTVVFRPRLAPVKQWLRWSDSVGDIVKVTMTVQAPAAYRTIIGLEGTDERRIYDQVIDTGLRTQLGNFAMPEAYTEATDVQKGEESQERARTELRGQRGTAAIEVEVIDGEPWTFGEDYEVGDLAKINISGVEIVERITRVTASDDRDNGLIFKPLIGENPAAANSNDLLVQAMANIAQQLRHVQSRR